MEGQNTAISFGTVDDLKKILAGEYRKQIENYFGDQKKALRFLSSVVADVQRTPKILECAPQTVINSYIMMAQLGFMPSGVSGEAYVIPRYNGKLKINEAQFQLGYQGLATLFYRAGIKKIVAEIVYEHDEFDYVNGEVTHRPDIWSENRGEAKGAYVLVTLPSGETVAKVMSKKEILEIGEKFSKSWGSKFTPWDSNNDPQLHMWRKTVLIQSSKLVPKSETLIRAIAEDHKESIIADRLPAARGAAEGLKMGALLKEPEDHVNKDEAEEAADGEKVIDLDAPEGDHQA